MAKQIKIELIIDIKDTGEVVVLAIPQPVGRMSISKSSGASQPSPSTSTTKPSPKPSVSTPKSSTPKTTQKSAKSGKKAGMINRIRTFIEQYPDLAVFLTENDVDVDNLENLNERQLNRAYAIAMDYIKRNKTGETPPEPNVDEDIPYFS